MLQICRSFFSGIHSLPVKKKKPCDLSIYLVANKPSYPDENVFFSKIMQSVKGGVTCVQFRDLTSDYNSTVKTALRLKQMLKDVPLFINTLQPLEVAHAVNAAGAYLEEPISHTEIKKKFHKKLIIGLPVKTIEDVLALEKCHEIDYLSVKIFPSKKTSSNNNVLWGIDGLRAVRQISSHRIVAIGGLNLESVESIYSELFINDGIAMSGGLMEQDSPFSTAQKISAIHKTIRGTL